MGAEVSIDTLNRGREHKFMTVTRVMGTDACKFDWLYRRYGLDKNKNRNSKDNQYVKLVLENTATQFNFSLELWIRWSRIRQFIPYFYIHGGYFGTQVNNQASASTRASHCTGQTAKSYFC